METKIVDGEEVAVEEYLEMLPRVTNDGSMVSLIVRGASVTFHDFYSGGDPHWQVAFTDWTGDHPETVTMDEVDTETIKEFAKELNTFVDNRLSQIEEET